MGQRAHGIACGVLAVGSAWLALGAAACSEPIRSTSDTGAGDAPPRTDAPLGPNACAQLTDVRSAPAGTLAPARVVEGVLVTYVWPARGALPASFFVQCGPVGPALHVRVDPATLTPPPAAGDLVSFDVTEISDALGAGGTGDVHSVTAIAGYARQASGLDTAPLVQDLSGVADLAARIEGYEAELVVVRGTIEGTWAAAGFEYMAAALRTAATPSGAVPELVLRVPNGAVASLGLADACDVSVGPSPLWRFETQPQAMGYRESDVVRGVCR